MVHDVFRKLADGDLKGPGDLAVLKPSILDKVCTDCCRRFWGGRCGPAQRKSKLVQAYRVLAQLARLARQLCTLPTRWTLQWSTSSRTGMPR